MGIYIPGMEMPDYGYVCLKVFANGEVLMTKEHRGALVITGINDKVGTAVSVPPHGRLIDADVLMELYADADEMPLGKMKVPIAVIRQNIVDMPTIIPAEEVK